MHPCTHALATHKHTRTQHTSTQARTQSTQPATDGTHSRLIFCSPARQLRDGAKAVAAAGCRLLSLRNKKAHEIALSIKRETGVLGIRRIEQGRNRLRRSQNFGEAGVGKLAPVRLWMGKDLCGQGQHVGGVAEILSKQKARLILLILPDRCLLTTSLPNHQHNACGRDARSGVAQTQLLRAEQPNLTDSALG